MGGRTTTTRERERKKITLYIGAQDDYYAVCSIYDCWGAKIYSCISFRSDDDNDDVPSSSISTQLRRYDFFSSISIVYCSYYCIFSYRYNSDYNSYRFPCHHMNVYVCAYISRDRENVPCFIAIDGRSVDLVRVFMCVCVCVCVCEFTIGTK